MRDGVRLRREHTALVVVDVQERLFKAMDLEQRESVVRNVKILASAARRLGVPLLVTEQYPRGLGQTLPEIREVLGELQPITKVSFSSCAVPEFVERLRHHGTRTVVLAGLEAHVCVLATALDLLAEGFAVHVPADATTSRNHQSAAWALDLLRAEGVMITVTETVVFQLLGRADTEEFRDLAPLLR